MKKNGKPLSLVTKRLYVQTAKVVLPAVIVLVCGGLEANKVIQYSTIAGYLITGCMLSVVIISWIEVRLWKIGKHEEAYITTFCLICFVALVFGRVALHAEVQGSGLYVYSTVFLVLTMFLVFVCSTEHAYNEKVIAKQEYSCKNVYTGRRYAHIFFNVLTYYVLPVFGWYLLSISFFYLCMYHVFSVVILLCFLVYDEKSRMKQKSIFWK